MDENPLDSKLVGYRARMLAAGTTEADEIVVLGGISSCLGRIPNGAAHGFISDVEEASGYVFRSQILGRLTVKICGNFLELLCHNLGVKLLISRLSEY